MISAMDMQKMDRERQARMFETMMESFLKRWEPEHPEDRYAFHAELHSLTRQIYRDAQEPLLDYITKLASAVPMFRSPLDGLVVGNLPDAPANTSGKL